MPTLVSAVSTILAALTVLGDAAVIAIFAALPFRRRFGRAAIALVGKYALAIGFLAAFIATSGSLFYSEVAGYTPCKLCWLQRIFMYPQVVLLGLALWRRERVITVLQTMILSAIGALIAAYHYYLQLGGNPLVPCGTVGYSVSCAQRFVLQFGYITIPMMALTAFLLILASGTASRLSQR